MREQINLHIFDEMGLISIIKVNDLRKIDDNVVELHIELVVKFFPGKH